MSKDAGEAGSVFRAGLLGQLKYQEDAAAVARVGALLGSVRELVPPWGERRAAGMGTVAVLRGVRAVALAGERLLRCEVLERRHGVDGRRIGEGLLDLVDVWTELSRLQRPRAKVEVDAEGEGLSGLARAWRDELGGLVRAMDRLMGWRLGGGAMRRARQGGEDRWERLVRRQALDGLDAHEATAVQVVAELLLEVAQAERESAPRREAPSVRAELAALAQDLAAAAALMKRVGAGEEASKHSKGPEDGEELHQMVVEWTNEVEALAERMREGLETWDAESGGREAVTEA